MSTLYTRPHPTTGEILDFGSLTDETRASYIEHDVFVILDEAAPPATHYVQLEPLAIVAYTSEELAAKAMAESTPGWVWEMPARRAVDQRTTDATRAAKVAEMSAACAAAIVAGFKSTALGAEHTYPAKPTDQTNLAGSILDSLIAGPGDWATPFWCADSAGAWDFRPHTAAQIQQVGRDGKAAILAAMTRNEALRAQIMESSIAQIDEIHW